MNGVEMFRVILYTNDFGIKKSAVRNNSLPFDTFLNVNIVIMTSKKEC